MKHIRVPCGPFKHSSIQQRVGGGCYRSVATAMVRTSDPSSAKSSHNHIDKHAHTYVYLYIRASFFAYCMNCMYHFDLQSVNRFIIERRAMYMYINIYNIMYAHACIIHTYICIYVICM